VVIVQHVDQLFAGGLASWLGDQTSLEVILINEGMRPSGGKVFVAGTNDHLVIGQDLAFHYTPEPKNDPYRPSVNVFFQSLYKYWLRLDCAVLLTGMGSDGANGLLALRKAGWHTIAQDKNTSIVYGMPKAAKDINAAAEILPIENIADSIIKHTKKG